MQVSTLFCVTYLVCLLRFSNSHRNYGFPIIFNTCRSPRCETVRCRSPQSLPCDFGVGTDRCNCCPYCLKGPGTPCAGPNNIEGNCAKGLVCIDAKLRRISDRRGPYTPVGECENRQSGGGSPFPPTSFPGSQCPKSCAAVSCIRPKRCQYGIGLDKCGCCPVCLNGPGTPCAGPNNKHGNCGKNLICVDAKLNEIPKLRGPNTPSGECELRSNGGDQTPPQDCICIAIDCNSLGETCPNGLQFDECGCCSCRDSDPSGNPLPTDPIPSNNGCPPDCSAVRCKQPDNCEFGFVTDECSCCPRCTKGLEEPCAGPNNVEGNCAENLVCVDARQNTIHRKRGQITPVGKCVVPYADGKSQTGHDRNSCSPTNCAAVSCLTPSNCRFGIGENICSCCPVCSKGPGERCGGPFNQAGVCGRRLKCVDTYGRTIPADGNRRNRIGKCQAIG